MHICKLYILNLFIMQKYILLKNFCLHFLLIISMTKSERKSIIFPFKVYQPKENKCSSQQEIFESKENNYIYSTFKIGNPPKEIPGLYFLYNSSLLINSNATFLFPFESDYIPSKSKTFINCENNKIQEQLIFNIENEEIIKNFTFLYLNQNKKDKNLYLRIGLQNFFKELNSNIIEPPNFLYQLKNHQLIDYISYSINYTSENEGFININIEPNEYAPNIYSDNKKFSTIVKGVTSKSINKFGEYLWSMDIETIFYENQEKNMIFISEENYIPNEDQYHVILNPRYGAIEGPFYYKKLIEKDFFNELKEKEICSLNREHKKLFYVCKSSYKKEIKEKFPNLYFYNKDFNYTFELNYEDLFFEKNEYLFFLICFDTGMFGEDIFSEISEWIFGKPFLKKYQFSFDVEKRIINFYENLNGYINNHDLDKNIKKYIYLNKNLNYVIFFLIIIFLLFYYFSVNTKTWNKIVAKNTNKDKSEKGKEYIEMEDILIEPK